MPPFNSEERSMYQRWFRKVAKYVGVLPTSFVLDGVKHISTFPVNGGWLADIYQGLYKKRKVAIKIIHTPIIAKNRRKVQKVLSSFPSNYRMFNADASIRWPCVKLS